MQVGIVGSGRMAIQLATYLVKCGCRLVVKVGDIGRTEQVKETLLKMLKKTTDNFDYLFSNILVVADYEIISSCDLIIETSKESAEYKLQIIRELSARCSDNAIIASNTSSIPIELLAKEYSAPDRVIGCHFFNPIHKMDLVELIVTPCTDGEVLSFMRQFVEKIGKVPIIVNDSPGFVVNRLLLPQINEAIRLMEQGVASKEDIDCAVKLGLNHPMGPFALADLIGLDVCYQILNEIFLQTKESFYAPANTLAHLVEQGNLGYKTGEGFYRYSTKK